MSIKHYFVLLVAILFTSCEDIIDVDLPEGDHYIVVDAWLNNLKHEQKITLSRSQPYFDNSSLDIIHDAEVSLIKNENEVYNFEYNGHDSYVWNSANIDSLGADGDILKLEISYNQNVYTATSKINRTTTIDSIVIEYIENETFIDDGYYAEFFARDPIGMGDTYWIKTYRNGQYLEDADELNIAYDAGFDAGTGIDGIIFISPIRELINEINEDGFRSPYELDDHIRVELHSIDVMGFQFLEIARDQILNGNNGIFTIPLANTKSNFSSSDPEEQVLGFFNIANVSVAETIVR